MGVARNLLVLLTGMLLGGLWSVYLGKELNWDLANYHFYNPFAFFNHRSAQDIWPMEFVHVHFTPTLDFLTYFLITVFSPKTTMFLLGTLHGINFFLLFVIARLLLGQTGLVPFLLALSLAFLGLYGPTVLPSIGSFQHDNLISLFVLGFLFLQLKSLQIWSVHLRIASYLQFFAGILLGIGVGAKLTAALYVPGAILALIFLSLPFRVKISFLFILSLGIGIGVLISSAYWMALLWEQHGNPIFPLWNGIFHSPDFPAINWHDERFLPKDWLQTLFYPFYFSWDGRTNDMPFLDFRFAILYGLLALFAIFKWREINRIRISSPLFAWLLLFFIFSYFFWQSYFSIMRYISALEMLAPLLIYLLIDRLCRNPSLRFTFSVLLFFFIFCTMVPAGFVRASWYENDYFNVKMPAHIKETKAAVVLVPISAFALNTKPRPQTYLIPFFPKSWQFVGISFLKDKYQTANLPTQLLAAKNTIYLLASSEYLPTLYTIAAMQGFKQHVRCDDITSDRQRISNEDLKLCLVSKFISRGELN